MASLLIADGGRRKNTLNSLGQECFFFGLGKRGSKWRQGERGSFLFALS